MNRPAWSAPTSREEAIRRVGGRRRYNRERREIAEERRDAIWRALWMTGLTMNEHGVEAALGRYFGYHKSTICRDFAALDAAGRGRWYQPGQPYDPVKVRRMLAVLNAGPPD